MDSVTILSEAALNTGTAVATHKGFPNPPPNAAALPQLDPLTHPFAHQHVLLPRAQPQLAPAGCI